MSTWPARLLTGCLAILLPAGAWAAATVGRAPSTVIPADARAGATGLGQAALLDEAAATTTALTVAPAPAPTIGPAPAPAPTTATTKPSVKATPTTRPPATSVSTVTLPPGVPWPNLPPPTGIPNIPAGSSWESQNAGVTARLRIEPATPVAGQPVTFRIDYSSAEPCCTVMLAFGDGSHYSLNNGVTCGELSPGSHSVATTHTYAAAGAYKPTLGVIAALPCTNWVGPGAPNPPDIHGTQVTGCIGVGPGPAAQKGCTPFPPFAPDQLVSPVIDPFCQVRSDCTQASTPRPGWDA
jgi:hypothetical protein